MTLPLAVHISHEAGLKIGGIGAVLDGLLSARAYNQAVQRTILAGPLPVWDRSQMARILAPNARLQVRYASRHGVFGLVSDALGRRLWHTEQALNVEILYGVARYASFRHEVILLNYADMDRQFVHDFAHGLWTDYGLDVARYGHDLEWQGAVDLALPLARAIEAVTADMPARRDCRCAIAHDWMGLPTAFALRMLHAAAWSVAFYAHETAPVRRLVEEHAGHDTRFYNAMRRGLENGLFLDNLFGSQDDLYKSPLLFQATRCDAVLAVSELVVDELRFLGADFQRRPIDRVYNGIPTQATELAAKRASRARLQAYCRRLLGYAPDYVLSHVTRLVLSKGLWRDAKVLAHLARLLQAERRSAVLFVLATSVPAGRDPDQVRSWEAAYGWPVGHRADNGDLVGAEAPFFFDVAEPFNRFHANVKIVLINQFGWNQARCGARMPADMTFDDLRIGSDLEFGQSIYEPFGIAQLEPLTHGSVCCVSSACGCGGFVRQAAADGAAAPFYVEADYITLPDAWWTTSPYRALEIDARVRHQLEETTSFAAAQRIHALLPRDDATRNRYLEMGQAASQAMSWETVAARQFAPALQRLQSRVR